MKKFLAIALSLVMILSLGACSNGEGDQPAVEGTALEIIEKIYEEAPVSLSSLMSTDFSNIAPEQMSYYTGLKDKSMLKDGAVSEPMMRAQAYSLVVVRVNEGEDANAVAKEMTKGINPAKWICVEADDLVVAAYGDVIMLYMINSELANEIGFNSARMAEAFNKVVGGKATVFKR